ncbi:hypothetical protein [Roseibium sp. Sym1]|uniref:hypothetical protein n=1 Tax=Roseibium sp. Sym1 TaxID=3016006 RepID=UPI0022B47C6A|nr:hypothetical protein [Roseibium sp. Sym1]
MAEGLQRVVSRTFRSLGLIAPLVLVLLHQTSSTSVASAQETLPSQNHLLAIGNCPPWKAQSVEVCKNSLEKVMKSLAPRLDSGPGNQHFLVNEGASAAALKLKATELANKLEPQDRLIIYANLPLGLSESAEADDANGYVLELWAEQKPETTSQAISDGTFMSASALAALIHTIPAGEVILILDTNNPHAIGIDLLANHKVDHKDRPEALVISSGPGQAANYSADRTISLFAKHLSIALEGTDGSLLDVMTAAVGGTRQAAIPICADLKGTLAEGDTQRSDCAQVPEIHDPDALLDKTMLLPLVESGLN